ncbi:hypothetical protein EBR43_03445 [bacterium]|nr:hypothetical protein [bacterium]
MSFGSFLKDLDGNLFRQYLFEAYADGDQKKANVTSAIETSKFKEPKFEKRLIDTLMDRLDKLPDDNEAVQFAIKRKIPREKFKNLYFIDDVSKIGQLSEKYKEALKTTEPRLVIPFYNQEDKLVGLTCRALRGEALRYLTVKIDEDALMVYNINNIEKNKDIFVVEGPLDSLFVDNAIAVAGTAFTKLTELNLPKDNMVVIVDNQPRNKEVVKLLGKVIDNNYKVVIWPQTLQEKDINDMVLAGRNIKNLINTNTHQGLQAKLKFTAWKRV